jgi:two-component system, LytTR family, response regulator
MIKVFILDDETASGNIIKNLLAKIANEEMRIAISNDALQAPEAIKDFKPDLLFLDVEMPGLNGFQVLNEIIDVKTNVVFTTAHEKYAIKAIKFSALDYLLKPIDRYELEATFNRFKEKVKDNWSVDNKALILNLTNNLKGKEEKFRLAINVKEGSFLFHLDEIISLEANNNYTKIYFTNHKPILVSKTLKDYNELLSEYNFIRIHKSYLVNKDYILSFDHDGNVILKDGIIAQVSRRNKSDLIEMFKLKK